MKRRSLLLIIPVFAGIAILNACANQNKEKKDDKEDVDSGQPVTGKYDFTKPVGKWVLPDQLMEISGIVKLDNNKMMAIEDLHPVLYILTLDGTKASISDTIPFYETAKDKFDMEDLAMIGNTVYALWSHGAVFKINDWQKTRKVTEIKTSLSKENNTEGIAYDPVTGNLLIACKDESGIEDEKKSSRAIFEYDVKADTLKATPFLLIEKKELEKMSGDKLKFYPSAVAVNPITHDVFVISTKDDKCIAQFSHDGKLKAFDYLDKDLLLQPEGLCFDAEGNLYISTEGKQGASPYIYEFAEQKAK